MTWEQNGTVIASEGGLYEIYTDGGERIQCKPRGRFRHEKKKLLVGDRILVSADEAGNKWVDEILERKNRLLRPPMANVTHLFLLISTALPDPVYENADKLIAIAEENRIETRIVVSKCDLSSENAEEIRAVYEKAGYPVFLFSTAEVGGRERLFSYIQRDCAGGIAAFAGASGVGKSTLLNSLFPALGRETGSVSEKIGRGKHTTRAVNLFPFAQLFGEGQGFLADTPGFSLLDFENFDFFGVEALPLNFKEFAPYLGHCRYTKCSHRKEEGCAVLKALEEGKIAPTRHKSYCILYDQLKNKREWGQ